MVRGERWHFFVGVVMFGNVLGLQQVTESVRRHHQFGIAHVAEWLIITLLAGAVWGWAMARVAPRSSLLWNEPPDRRRAVEDALRHGRVVEDPELRSLEFTVAAQRYRSQGFLVGWGLGIAVFVIGMYWWQTASMDDPPTGYRWFLVLTLALFAGSGLCLVVEMWRRNEPLEQVLAQRREVILE